MHLVPRENLPEPNSQGRNVATESGHLMWNDDLSLTQHEMEIFYPDLHTNDPNFDAPPISLPDAPTSSPNAHYVSVPNYCSNPTPMPSVVNMTSPLLLESSPNTISDPLFENVPTPPNSNPTQENNLVNPAPNTTIENIPTDPNTIPDPMTENVPSDPNSQQNEPAILNSSPNSTGVPTSANSNDTS